jgi:adenylate cyclase
MTGAPSPATAGAAAEARISGPDLAIQSAVPEAEIADIVRRGLISGPASNGTYDRGNVSRLRLIKALEQSGIAIETLAAAAEKGLSFDFAGHILAEPVGLSAMTVAEACRACGLDADTFRAVMLAIGVAAPAPDEPIREDDLELIGIAGAVVREGVPVEAVVRVLRAFGINMRAVAEAERDLFRRQLEEATLARGVPYHEMLAMTAPKRIPLQRAGFRTIFLLHRRFREQLVYDNLVARFEDALEENQVKRERTVSQAICFVDLSGFTERTEHRGDRDAAATGSAFVDIAQTEATVHRGNLVKPLGDGAMLRFKRADDAVRGALGVLSHARRRNLPAARAGVAMGPLIMQDGDYYGRTVNRASRLLGIAAPHQVLVTAEVAQTARDARLTFTNLGRVRLKGVAEDVEAFAAAAD